MASPARRILFGIAGSVLLLAFGSASADPSFPALTGRVVDDANLLSAADREQITADLKALEDKSSDQVVVVTLPSLQGYTIEDYGYRLGRAWGIGTKQLSNGVLLIVAPNERKVRIEVGYGLEPILTDALSKVIIDNAILPRFRSGDYAAGIKDGVHDISAALTGDAAELAERAKARHDADNPALDWYAVFFWIFILLLFIWMMSPRRMRGYRSGYGSGPIFLPGPGWGGSGGGGGWSSGGGDGGGFSGGGGSFGGGGASGGW